MIDINKTKSQILDLLVSVNRPGMDDTLDWLKSTDFFEAPASSIWHLNIEGGLAYHSLSVYRTLDILCKTFSVPLSNDTKIITGLLHDVCKIDIYKKSDKVILDEGNLFEYKRDDTYPIGHGEKSVILLLSHGLALTPNEISMIRWHMSMYDPSYKRDSNNIKKHFPMSKMLYFADDLSTTYLEDDP